MNISISNILGEGISTIVKYSTTIKNIILLLLACAFFIVVIKIIAEMGKK